MIENYVVVVDKWAILKLIGSFDIMRCESKSLKVVRHSPTGHSYHYNHSKQKNIWFKPRWRRTIMYSDTSGTCFFSLNWNNSHIMNISFYAPVSYTSVDRVACIVFITSGHWERGRKESINYRIAFEFLFQFLFLSNYLPIVGYCGVLVRHIGWKNDIALFPITFSYSFGFVWKSDTRGAWQCGDDKWKTRTVFFFIQTFAYWNKIMLLNYPSIYIHAHTAHGRHMIIFTLNMVERVNKHQMDCSFLFRLYSIFSMFFNCLFFLGAVISAQFRRK